MADWKTLKTTEVQTGNNTFIEVSLKQPPEGDNKFIAISKGWITESGDKRYKANILFSKEKKDDIIKAMNQIAGN